MILKKPNSRIYIVNLLADHILNQIPTSEESIISISDFTNFFVIKGKTTSKEILDLSKICENFSEKYELEKPISHTIDLIEYDCKLNFVKNITSTFYKSDNCSFHNSQIEKYSNSDKSFDFQYVPVELSDDYIVVSSEFPHGYSLNQGRLLHLYGKHIFYSIPSNYPVNGITLELSTEKNDLGENLISVFNHGTNSYDEVLKSAILDVFDFDLSWLSLEMKKVDWSIELTNPLEDYPFIKKINKDFIIF